MAERGSGGVGGSAGSTQRTSAATELSKPRPHLTLIAAGKELGDEAEPAHRRLWRRAARHREQSTEPLLRCHRDHRGLRAQVGRAAASPTPRLGPPAVSGDARIAHPASAAQRVEGGKAAWRQQCLVAQRPALDLHLLKAHDVSVQEPQRLLETLAPSPTHRRKPIHVPAHDPHPPRATD